MDNLSKAYTLSGRHITSNLRSSGRFELPPRNLKGQPAVRYHRLSPVPRLIVAISLAIICPGLAWAQEVYGPINFLKTMKTPFGMPNSPKQETAGSDPLAELSLSGDDPSPAQSRIRTLTERLLPAQLFLPGKMVLGKEAEFVVKGKPRSWVALAMADRNSGAKPIQGHVLKLGPDRKVVSVGQLNASGLLSLFIETPIEGDLIGQNLYFEAAVWSRPDFGDVQFATPVASQSANGGDNGVLIAAATSQKKGIKFVADPAVPLLERARHNTMVLESGQP